MMEVMRDLENDMLSVLGEDGLVANPAFLPYWGVVREVKEMVEIYHSGLDWADPMDKEAVY